MVMEASCNADLCLKLGCTCAMKHRVELREAAILMDSVQYEYMSGKDTSIAATGF